MDTLVCVCVCEQGPGAGLLGGGSAGRLSGALAVSWWRGRWLSSGGWVLVLACDSLQTAAHTPPDLFGRGLHPHQATQGNLRSSAG